MSELKFKHFRYQGADAEKFLQGQVTVNVTKLSNERYQATAICDLKGRVHFGIWLKRHSSEDISIVVLDDLANELQAHIKKYGAFSKAKLSEMVDIYPVIISSQVDFSLLVDESCAIETWKISAIQTGQAWISQQTSHVFQPQELRLHQRHGVDYDKGCYLGQEIVARLWFKAQPKRWLHLIQGSGDCPQDGAELHPDAQVVNAVMNDNVWLALVVAKPSALEELSGIQMLDLPEPLNGDVARAK